MPYSNRNIKNGVFLFEVPGLTIILRQFELVGRYSFFLFFPGTDQEKRRFIKSLLVGLELFSMQFCAEEKLEKKG